MILSLTKAHVDEASVMFEAIRNRLLMESFRPGWVGFITNPFYIARKELYGHISHLAPRLYGRVLDVGCGIKPYRDLFRVDEYVGLEIDSQANRLKKAADYFYDGTAFPFESESFDAVITNQVLEHVFEPEVFVKEICRVLRNGGCLLLTVPFLWDEHEQPFDYGRYTSFGLRHLLEKNGLAVVEHRKTARGLDLHCQLVCCYLVKRVRRWRPLLKLGAWITFSAPLNCLATLLRKLCPAGEDLYLDNVVFAIKSQQSSAS